MAVERSPSVVRTLYSNSHLQLLEIKFSLILYLGTAKNRSYLIRSLKSRQKTNRSTKGGQIFQLRLVNPKVKSQKLKTKNQKKKKKPPSAGFFGRFWRVAAHNLQPKHSEIYCHKGATLLLIFFLYFCLCFPFFSFSRGN